LSRLSASAGVHVSRHAAGDRLRRTPRDPSDHHEQAQLFVTAEAMLDAGRDERRVTTIA
jgi:hypothetical protein